NRLAGGDCAIRRSGKSNSKSLFFTLASTRPTNPTAQAINPRLCRQYRLRLQNLRTVRRTGKRAL
ncbi:MAG: hypothetical protein VX007_05865, partial [Pseudomonadota bacterium]|nr:hypothetical protein [Pseudomonadota bacterium]